MVSYVALKAGSELNREAIRAHCAARLAELKTPKEIVIRDTLPRTPRGKLDRNTLAKTWRKADDT